MTMLKHALEYAANGWAVFPVYGVVQGQCTCGQNECSRAGKHPMTINGFKDATTEPNIIQIWWDTYPNANIGIATGSMSGLSVIDVDHGQGKDGFKNLETLEKEHGIIPRNICVRTGSGGLHIYLAAPDEPIGISASRLAKHIDVRGDGGYVVAPPSNHISGNSYTWENPDEE